VSPIFAVGECGLIGIAFDPDFVSNGYVYVFATVSTSEQQIIRYTAVGDVGTDKTVVIPGLPTVGANHDGGAVGFGPDGRLLRTELLQPEYAYDVVGRSTGRSATWATGRAPTPI